MPHGGVGIIQNSPSMHAFLYYPPLNHCILDEPREATVLFAFICCRILVNLYIVFKPVLADLLSSHSRVPLNMA